METTTATNSKPTNAERREQLKQLSEQVKPLVKEGKFEKLNEAIIQTFYRNESHQEFKTFWQWVGDGFRVRKGELAFCVWAKPLSEQYKLKGELLGDDQRVFYPLCYLFSNAQVEPIKK